MSGAHRGWLPKSQEEDFERQIPDRVLLTKLVKYILPYRRRLLIAVVAILITSLMALLPPYFLSIAIDKYIAQRDSMGLTFIALAMIVVYVLNWIADYHRTYQVLWIGQNMVNEMRKQLFSHLQDLSFSFYDRSETGRIMSRVTNDTDNVSQVFVQGVVTVISDILTLAAIIVVMLWFSVALTLATLLVLPILTIATLFFQAKLRQAFRATRKKIAVVTSHLEESVSGIQEIKSFTREKDSMETFRQVNIENLQANVQAGKIFALTRPTVEIIGSIGTGIVLWASGILTISGAITIGIVIAFLLWINRFFRPIIDLAMFYNTVQSSLAAAERIFAVLEATPKITNCANAIELSNVKGEIIFENVTFSYTEDKPVLKKVNVQIQPGKTLAIVGPTGAGKSTLVKLLSRFYEPQSGTITIDGHDVRKVTLDSLHKQMGIVLQEPFLFSGTVKENIRYGTLDATDEEVQNVAKTIGVHDFISTLPKGYDTDVGERGKRLSIGQRQLVSFARALLRDPPILILDEATSSIDPYTELKIQNSLSILLKNRTTLAIAHRLSTVRNAEKIIVLNEGRIVEVGNHKELMNKKGLYYQLYKKQFRDTA